ncbi:MAG: hypothetical protein JWM12_3136, partial [Ilumatobacteraceae bacterium]|nr:hypothetical protein [Ilumatobacteraceae bacterium]
MVIPLPMNRRQRCDVLRVARDRGRLDGAFDVSGDPVDVEGAAECDADTDHAVVVRTRESFDTFVVSHGQTLVRCAYLIVGDTGAAQD